MDQATTWVLLHFLLAAVATWLARRYALRLQLLDQPGERRSHAVPTPRGGGVGIVVAVLSGVVWLWLQWPPHRVLLGCVAAGLLLVAGIGFVDDHRSLSPWSRLAVQVVASALLAWGFHQATGLAGTAVVGFVLAMVLINIWNFMDGIDGLAASQAAIVATGLALAMASGPWAWLAAGLAAAVLGFLPFNFPRARIFLGDVGSGALGYLLAALLTAAYAWSGLYWPLLLLPLAAFGVDAAFTLLTRMWAGQRWWTPHVSHAYQAWAKRAGNHVLATLAYAIFTGVGVILMLAGISWRPWTVVGAGVLWYLLAILLWARLRKDVPMGKETQP